MSVDPNIDPRKVSELRKKYGEIRYCCKCHMVLLDDPETPPYFYYEGEGFYCGHCKDVHKEPR